MKRPFSPAKFMTTAMVMADLDDTIAVGDSKVLVGVTVIVAVGVSVGGVFAIFEGSGVDGVSVVAVGVVDTSATTSSLVGFIVRVLENEQASRFCVQKATPPVTQTNPTINSIAIIHREDAFDNLCFSDMVKKFSLQA